MKNKEEKKNFSLTGIGGIFFKADDPDRIKSWYSSNLGINTDEWGTMFKFREESDPSRTAYLQWSPMNKDTDYFSPSKKEFMINYRVENIEILVEELKKKGIEFLDEIEEFEYGKFIHLLDPEGNKIELWEPIDGGF